MENKVIEFKVHNEDDGTSKRWHKVTVSSAIWLRESLNCFHPAHR